MKDNKKRISKPTKKKINTSRIPELINVNNGYALIPNEIYMTLAKTNFKNNCLGLINCIIFNTFGFVDKSKSGKKSENRIKEAIITGNDFYNYTGIIKSHLSEHLKS